MLELESGDGYYTRILGEYLEPTRDGLSRLSVLVPLVAPHVFTDPREPGPLLDRWLDLEALTQSLEPRAELIPGVPVAKWSTPARFDFVLGFRVAHVYRARHEERAVYAAVRSALRPGGVFAVIAHRAPVDRLAKGYLAESSVVEAVTRAGFTLEARSEINANAKDTHDHPHGVWSLPPTLRDGSKYAAVGESDRMTLRFRRVE